MKEVITGIVVEVEITGYDENQLNGDGIPKVSARPKTFPKFQVLESNIPEPVLEWVKTVLKQMGG